MDTAHVAALIRALRARPSRRAVATALVTLGASTTLASLVAPETSAKGKGKGKGKGKKKKKKQAPEDELPRCLLPCGDGCCTAAQPTCCHGTLQSLCYDEATESCCPDLGGQMAAVCPRQTRCEFFDDPDDTVGAASFCCPSGTTTCGFGCCPEGSVCCPGLASDPGYAWSCCPDASCDEVGTDCISNGDYVVDPRIF